MPVAGTDLTRARHAVDIGIEWAEQHGVQMTIVVLDLSGSVRAAAQMDGARSITYEIALAKANTAREFRTPTAELAANVKPENKIAIGQLGARIAFLGGGVPVLDGGVLIGAIGASGGSESEDVVCAEACLAAFGSGAAG